MGRRGSSFGEVLIRSPWFMLENWGGDKIRLYLASPLGESVLRRVTGLRSENPPSLEGYYRVELRSDNYWEANPPLEWESVYELLQGRDAAVQVTAVRDPKTVKVLLGKAKALRGGGRSGIALQVMEVFEEAFGQDPAKRYRLERYRRDPAEEELRRKRSQDIVARTRSGPLYVVRIRVYARDKHLARELGELVALRFTRPLRVKSPFVGGLVKDSSKERLVWRAAGLFGSPPGIYPWLTVEEIKHMLVLPDPSLLPVEAERTEELPEVLPSRGSGVLLGYTSRGGRPVYLGLEDFYRHVYVVGSTGSGKTTTLERLVEQLRDVYRDRANLVVIDPHGDFAREVAGMFWGEQGVYYLHPLEAPFALNPLELPRGLPRDVAVMLAVDQLMEIFEKLFLLGESAVYVRYILQTGLRLLYRRTDSPTFTDLYEMIVALREGSLDLPVDDPEYREALGVIRGLQDQSFISAIARLELIAKTPLLARTFSQTSIPDDVLLGPGNLVVFNLSKAELGSNASYLLMAGVLLKLWYLVLARARGGGERTPVIVFIDEFQNVARLQAVDVILSEARKYGLHLVLAHQHSRQLGEDLVQSIYSNTGVKVLMRTIGPDAERFSRVDPHYARELRKTLPALSVGQAVLILTPRRGEEAAPVRVDVEPPVSRSRPFTPRSVFAPRVGVGGVGGGRVVWLLNPVLALLPGERLSPVEQLVLYRVWRASRGGRGVVEWSRVLAGLGLRRQRAEEARDSLAARGLLKAWKEGGRWLVRYARGLFRGLKTVAPSREGRRVAARALLYYLEHGYYAVPARQAGPASPDLVAVPFDRAQLRLRYGEAVAVEIESCNELETHPEQVARNLVKAWELHQQGVVKRVDFWTAEQCRNRLESILEEAARQNKIPAEAYQIHTVELREKKQARQQEEPSHETQEQPTSEAKKPEPQPEEEPLKRPTSQTQAKPTTEPENNQKQKPQEPQTIEITLPTGHTIKLTPETHKTLKRLQAQRYKITTYNPKTKTITLQKPGKPPKHLKTL